MINYDNVIKISKSLLAIINHWDYTMPGEVKNHFKPVIL